MIARYRGKTIWRRVNKQLTHLEPVDLRGKCYVGLKLQTFAYFVYNASCTVSRYLGRFRLSLFLHAFPFDLTFSITSISPQFDGVRLPLENFQRIQWAIFVASRSRGSNPVFHWSAA